jgi:hypothetical protein
MITPDYHYGTGGMEIQQVAEEFAPRHRNPMVLINWYNVLKYLLRYHRKAKKAQQLLDLRKCYTSLVQLMELYDDSRLGKPITITSGVSEPEEVSSGFPRAYTGQELSRTVPEEANRSGGTGVPATTEGRDTGTGGKFGFDPRVPKDFD